MTRNVCNTGFLCILLFNITLKLVIFHSFYDLNFLFSSTLNRKWSGYFTLVILMLFGLGWSLSVPLINSLKKASNFFRLSPLIVPPMDHTMAKINRHWSQLVICAKQESIELIQQHLLIAHEPGQQAPQTVGNQISKYSHVITMGKEWTLKDRLQKNEGLLQSTRKD